MTLSRITGRKNVALDSFEEQRAIDEAAEHTRARFATPGKHAIYADKRDEAARYLELAGSGQPIDMAAFPYLSAEAGVSAETPLDLAELWLSMDAQWRAVAAVVEQVSIGAKAQVRACRSRAEMKPVVAAAVAALDAIGEKPPERPRQRAPGGQ